MHHPAHSFDTETHLIQPGLLAPPLVCGSFAWGDDAELCDANETIAKIWNLLVNGRHIVGANIAFDFGVVLARCPEMAPAIFKAYDEDRIHDVQIRQALDALAKGELYQNPGGGPLRDPETGKQTDRYSLAICVWQVLKRKMAKADTYRMKYATLDGVPLEKWPKAAIDYSLTDATLTLEVYDGQAGFRNLNDEGAQCRAAFALHLSSMWGIRTDAARVATLGERVEKQFAADLAKFQLAGFIRADGSCDKKALRALVTKAYQGNPPKTKGGAKRGPEISTDRLTLQDSGDELLMEYAETGETRTLHNTFLPTLYLGTRVGINPSIKVLLETGRISYSAPNLQNLPRKGGIRECCKARDGYVYGFVDYSALELSTLAQVCFLLVGYSSMREAINAGGDLHALLAGDLIGSTEAGIKSGIQAGSKIAEDMRFAAKAGNFGFPGGMGAAKFVLTKRREGLRLCTSMHKAEVCGAQGMITEYKGRTYPPLCVVCVEAAEELRDAWFKRWTEMRGYFRIVSGETESGSGEIEQLVSKRIRGGCGFTDGANTRFQGLAADGVKRGLWLCQREAHTDPRSPLWGSHLVAQVHDELIYEHPEARAHEALKRQEQLMIQGMREYTPDVAIRVEGALGRYWYKGAKAVEVDGRIVPVYPLVVNGKTTWEYDIAF